MRLAKFPSPEGLRSSIVIGAESAALTAVDGPGDLLSLLRDGQPAGPAKGLLRRAPRMPLDEAKLLASIPRPGKFLAIGMNARDRRCYVNLRRPAQEPGNIR